MLYSKTKKNDNIRIAGEVDLIAFKGKVCDLYEVKCSNRLIKAKNQLKRLREILDKTHPVRHLYLYCGESKNIEKISGVSKKTENIKEIEMPPSVKNLY